MRGLYVVSLIVVWVAMALLMWRRVSDGEVAAKQLLDVGRGEGSAQQVDVQGGEGSAKPVDVQGGEGSAKPVDVQGGEGSAKPVDVQGGEGSANAVEVDHGMGQQGGRVIGFYHSWTLDKTSIVTEQMETLKKHGLWELTAELRVHLFGRGRDSARMDLLGVFGESEQKVVLAINATEGWEDDTLGAMHVYCSENRNIDDVVYYFHSKGSFHSHEFNHFRRRELDAWTIGTHWKVCYSLILEDGVGVCGEEVRTHPHIHISGNFFWASCRAVRTLAHPRIRENLTRERTENGYNFACMELPSGNMLPENAACNMDHMLGIGRYHAEHWIMSRLDVALASAKNSEATPFFEPDVAALRLYGAQGWAARVAFDWELGLLTNVGQNLRGTPRRELVSLEGNLALAWEYCRANKMHWIHFNPREGDHREEAARCLAALGRGANVCASSLKVRPHMHLESIRFWATCEFVSSLSGPPETTKENDKILYEPPVNVGGAGSPAPLSEACLGMGAHAANHWILSHPSLAFAWAHRDGFLSQEDLAFRTSPHEDWCYVLRIVADSLAIYGRHVEDARSARLGRAV